MVADVEAGSGTVLQRPMQEAEAKLQEATAELAQLRRRLQARRIPWGARARPKKSPKLGVGWDPILVGR